MAKHLSLSPEDLSMLDHKAVMTPSSLRKGRSWTGVLGVKVSDKALALGLAHKMARIGWFLPSYNTKEIDGSPTTTE